MKMKPPSGSQKTKPNKANLERAQMSTSLYEQKDCEKGPLGAFRKNKPNLSTRLKTGQSQSDCGNGLRRDEFQTLPCKNGASRVSTVEVISLECTIDDYGKIFAG